MQRNGLQQLVAAVEVNFLFRMVTKIIKYVNFQTTQIGNSNSFLRHRLRGAGESGYAL